MIYDLDPLGLDDLVAEAGWSRHVPNPFLLVGSATPGRLASLVMPTFVGMTGRHSGDRWVTVRGA